MNYERKTMTTNFEPLECVIFVQSTKIDTHENKAIHSEHIKLYGACLLLTTYIFNLSEMNQEVFDILYQVYASSLQLLISTNFAGSI